MRDVLTIEQAIIEVLKPTTCAVRLRIDDARFMSLPAPWYRDDTLPKDGTETYVHPERLARINSVLDDESPHCASHFSK